ncbi:MAG: glycosyltransferase family 4 protein [Lachnospiraceae bacterium]|nr:glycosyltransferase family 4 protein [Lachnospiraceae bacterium]
MSDRIKRKIMFHINCLEHGGAERVVSNLANKFAEEGYDVTVAVEWIADNEYPLDERIAHINIGLTPEDSKKGRIAKYLTRIRRLKECIRQTDPDIVIAFAHLAIYRTLMATYRMKVPVLISVRTDPVGHYDGRLDKLFIPRLFPRADGCVFQTAGQRDFFKPFLQDNSLIILNPLSMKYIGVEPPATRRKVVVQSGRLVDFKFQHMLIDAFMDVHATHPDWSLEIYGGDSFDGTKEILEERINRYNASEFIHLMGDSDNLEHDLNDGGVYAFSSEWEGLPNALMEAMALGLPIVSTDCPCGGPATLITDGVDGLLVKNRDQDALAEGMNRLIEDRDLAEKLGNNARKVIDRAHPDIVFKQWEEYVNRIIEDKRAGSVHK